MSSKLQNFKTGKTDIIHTTIIFSESLVPNHIKKGKKNKLTLLTSIQW